MAAVTLKYKDSIIAEMTEAGSKTLKTSGTYCEGDVKVEYAPNLRIYEFTLAKSSGWVLLATLDDDVVAHINDASLTVVLQYTGDEYVSYCMGMLALSNAPPGQQGNYPTYGVSIRSSSETATQVQRCYYPPNQTGTSDSLGGGGMFRIDGNKYYCRPSDGFVHAGSHRLIFTW